MAKKKTVKKKSEGLGDTVEKITKATGIKKLVKFVAGDDCGCEERRKKLNKLFSYAPDVKCLVEDEYHILSGWFAIERSTVTPNEQQELRKIHNRVFNTNKAPSTCGSCVKDLYNTMQRLFNEYEQETQA